MKILHAWGIGSSGFIFTRWLNKLGHESKLINPVDNDFYQYSQYYTETEKVDPNPKIFSDYVAEQSKNYDLIHIRSNFGLLPKIKKTNPKIPIVLQFHGTELRLPEDLLKFRKNCLKLADKILVSTEDLLEYDKSYFYLPNPIDTELFRPTDQKPIYDYLNVSKLPEDAARIQKFLMKNNFKDKFAFVASWDQPIYYAAGPDFIRQFRYYIDIKFNKLYHNFEKPFPVRSLHGLEALALGLEVLIQDMTKIKGLPKQHDPYVATNKLIKEVYEKLL